MIEEEINVTINICGLRLGDRFETISDDGGNYMATIIGRDEIYTICILEGTEYHGKPNVFYLTNNNRLRLDGDKYKLIRKTK